MNPEIEIHRLYVTRFEKDGEIWHRLRLGFFQSVTAARQALEGLRSAYPDAWVTRIPPEEALASAATAIYEPPSTPGNPTLLARVLPEPLGEPPETAGFPLSFTMPETVAGFSVAFGTVGERQSTPEAAAPLEGSNSPSAAPQSDDTSVLESSGVASRGFRFRGMTYRASSGELALLQRWDQNAEDLQKGGTNFALEGQDGLVGYSLGLEGEANVERTGANRGMIEADEWKQSFAAHGDLSLGKAANLQFKNQLIEQRDEDEEYIGSFLVRREPDAWRQNRISLSELTIGLLEDRLTSQTVLNTSRYTDSDLDGNYVVGYQLLQRLALDVWRGEDSRVSVFGAYGEVDQNFNESLYDDADNIKKKMDAFSEPGQAGTRFGGTFGLGPADLTVTQTDSWDAENSDGSQKTAYETTLGLDVNRLRGLTGGLLGETFWNIAPDSVYLSYGLGAVDPHSGAATEDRTTNMSAGANWNWDSGYGYLSYWSSYYDNRQPRIEDYDWAGDGLDVGGGMWGNRWNFDGWLSLSRSEQMGEWSESSDLSLGGGLSVGYRLDELPDLKISLSSDHYRGDYIASHGTSQSGSWIFTSELDFTKYWAELWAPRPSNLGMVFQLRNDSSFEKWGSNSQQNSDTNYFIGLTMKIGLGE